MTVLITKPFADAQGVFKSLQYRTNPSEKFLTLDIDGSVVNHLVYSDDLRAIPVHEFKLELDLDALKPHYSAYVNSLRLALIVRDPILRREIVLDSVPLDAVPDVIRLSREKLLLTCHRDQLPIEIVVVSAGALGRTAAVPSQRLSRLAELSLRIRNNVRGASFPYKPVTAQEMLEAGLPSEVAVHLKLHGDAAELVAGQTPAENVFEVWIHEKAWSAMQRDRAPVSSGLRFSAVTITTASLIFASAATYVASSKGKETGIDPESVVGKLLAFLERQSNLPEGDLVKKFQQHADASELLTYIQHAFRFVGSTSRVEEETAE